MDTKTLLEAARVLRVRAARAEKIASRPKARPVQGPAVARPVTGVCSLDVQPRVPLQFAYDSVPVPENPAWRMRATEDRVTREAYSHPRAEWVRHDPLKGDVLPRLDRYPDVKGRSDPSVRDLPLGPHRVNTGRLVVRPNKAPLPPLNVRKRGPIAPNLGRQAYESYEGPPAPRRKARKARVPWHVFAVRRAVRLGAAYAWLRKVKGTESETIARRLIDDARKDFSPRDRELLNERLP